MMFSSRLGALGIAALAVVAVAGCGSGGSGASASPAWAKSLGSGVKLTSGNASADDGSAGGALLGVVSADETGNYLKICSYYPPGQQSDCKSSVGKATKAQLKAALPTYKNITVTYTAVKGSEALVGVTGTVCNPNQTPSCTTNSKPAAVFDTAKPFGTLWSETIKANSSAYSLAALRQTAGKWYIYTSSTS